MNVSRYRKSTLVETGIIILVIILIMGCSGKGNPVVPEEGGSNQAGITQAGNLPEQRFVMGFWDIGINVEQMTAEILPMRNAQLHFNILQMLEGWACTDCVTIENIEWSPDVTLLVDLAIRNPFPPDRLDITARDTRGVIIFDADPGSYFPNHTVRNKYGNYKPLNASRVILNPDGYTTHYNRETAFEGIYMNQYRRGRYTPPEESEIVGNLHAFKAFYSHEQGRLLYPGKTSVRTYELDVEQWTYFRFGYSVDACWQMPITWPVVNPWTDFAKSAGSLEPYQVSMSIMSNTINRHGGSASLLVDVMDHQGFDSISAITIEAPDLFNGVIHIDPDSYLWDSYPVTRYQIQVDNTAGYGSIENGGSNLLICVEDIAMSVVGDDLRAINIWTIPVADVQSSWRPREGSFVDLKFPGPDPYGVIQDFTVISNPHDDWAFTPGESMLLFLDEYNEKYLAYNRYLTDYKYFAGYPGSPGSWLHTLQRIDAAAGGAFGVHSDSNTTVDSGYRVKNCTSMHLPGGAFNACWYTGSLNDPSPYLELGGDVSGGFGLTYGDPVYAIYIYDSTAGYPAQSVSSLHRIADPYDDPHNAFRAMIPSQGLMTGEIGPFQYGVCYPAFVAMGVDDRIPGEPNQFIADIYTIENRVLSLNDHLREMDVYRINFTAPLSYQRIRTYTNSMLGASTAWPVSNTPRIVDVDVLPAQPLQVYMGFGHYPQHNWVAVLYTFATGSWFVEIFDVYDETGVMGDNWKKPIYTIGPYTGLGVAMDVDPVDFEIYVLSNDMSAGSDPYRLSCFEYY